MLNRDQRANNHSNYLFMNATADNPLSAGPTNEATPSAIEKRIGKVFGKDIRLQRKTFAITILVLLFSLPLATLIRARIGDLHPSLVVILGIAMASCLPTLFCSRYPRLEKFAGHLLITIITACFIAITALNGGLQAPFFATAPILPLIAAFLLGSKAGLMMASAVTLYIAALIFHPIAISDLGSPPLSNSQRILASGLFVSLISAAVAVIALCYELRFRRLQSALKYSASHDSLTGLANRQTFESALLKTTDKKSLHQPVSLIVVDIDHFKQYNDSHGHQAGDSVLKTVAMAAHSSALRPRDLVARFGGDEFVIVLPNTNADDAIRVADRLRKNVAQQRLNLNHQNPHDNHAADEEIITLSIGVATQTPSHEGDITQFTSKLLALADAAMYSAKKAGRNRVVLSQLSETTSARENQGIQAA